MMSLVLSFLYRLTDQWGDNCVYDCFVGSLVMPTFEAISASFSFPIQTLINRVCSVTQYRLIYRDGVLLSLAWAACDSNRTKCHKPKYKPTNLQRNNYSIPC